MDDRFDFPEVYDDFSAMCSELSDEFFESAVKTIPEDVWVTSWDFIAAFCAR